MSRARNSAWWALAGLVLLLVLLAFARPIDHDESQYIAAAVLARSGLPYRDFAYLQTPLQPIVFAPLTALFGAWTYPGLRLVNALLGAIAVAAVYGAARASGASERIALCGAGLFASCDIVLFSVAVARNDALPVACLALALWLMIRAEHGRSAPSAAALTGFLLAAAAATKISYALPALACGLYAVIDRRHRPMWLVAGVIPVAALVLWTFVAAPSGFLFGVLDFPAHAPAQYYAAHGQAWKLSLAAKAIDTLKFLGLGPALLALVLVVLAPRERGPARLLDLMILAGLIAALLPEPSWRQYLLPVLPPLFVRLALLWEAQPPARALRIAACVFVGAGLAPSLVALAEARRGLPMLIAARQGSAIRATLDSARVTGPVATLAPEFLPATRRLPDRRFATGPFYFRSDGLLGEDQEDEDRLVSARWLAEHFGGADHPRPAAILIGGEGKWTSGDDALDGDLERWAIARHWPRIDVPGGRFRLYVRPR